MSAQIGSLGKKIKEGRHVYMMWFWIILVPITLLTPLKESVPFIVFMSLYANIEASASAHEARKARKTD